MPFTAAQTWCGLLAIVKAKIEKLYAMTNMAHDECGTFARQLRSMGVDQALREAGPNPVI